MQSTFGSLSSVWQPQHRLDWRQRRTRAYLSPKATVPSGGCRKHHLAPDPTLPAYSPESFDGASFTTGDNGEPTTQRRTFRHQEIAERLHLRQLPNRRCNRIRSRHDINKLHYRGTRRSPHPAATPHAAHSPRHLVAKIYRQIRRIFAYIRQSILRKRHAIPSSFIPCTEHTHLRQARLSPPLQRQPCRQGRVYRYHDSLPRRHSDFQQRQTPRLQESAARHRLSRLTAATAVNVYRVAVP